MRLESTAPMNSDQLELFAATAMGCVSVPWEGRSPRELTRVGMSSIFQSREKECMSELISPGQCELWPIVKEGPPVRRGAPLLVEP